MAAMATMATGAQQSTEACKANNLDRRKYRAAIVDVLCMSKRGSKSIEGIDRQGHRVRVFVRIGDGERIGCAKGLNFVQEVMKVKWWVQEDLKVTVGALVSCT